MKGSSRSSSNQIFNHKPKQNQPANPWPEGALLTAVKNLSEKTQAAAIAISTLAQSHLTSGIWEALPQWSDLWWFTLKWSLAISKFHLCAKSLSSAFHLILENSLTMGITKHLRKAYVWGRKVNRKNNPRRNIQFREYKKSQIKTYRTNCSRDVTRSVKQEHDARKEESENGKELLETKYSIDQ